MKDGDEVNVADMLNVTEFMPLDLPKRHIERREVNGVVLLLVFQQEA